MDFVVNHAPGAGSIAGPVKQQSGTLPLTTDIIIYSCAPPRPPCRMHTAGCPGLPQADAPYRGSHGHATSQLLHVFLVPQRSVPRHQREGARGAGGHRGEATDVRRRPQDQTPRQRSRSTRQRQSCKSVRLFYQCVLQFEDGGGGGDIDIAL